MLRYLKKHIIDIFIVLVGLTGLAIVAYPTVSNYWNQRVQSKAIREYDKLVDSTSKEELEKDKVAAHLYNDRLYQMQSSGMGEYDEDEYESILNIGGDGIMGYITIPTINLQLPIYHGTEEKFLQIAIGHNKTTSVPIGGKNTHAMLLGHRGLPSATLFNDLDQLIEGDTFDIHILDEVLQYKIYDIEIVEPIELNKLRIKKGKDLITLVTCTPYGINTHRLLIHGERFMEDTEETVIFSEAKRIERLQAVAVIAVLLWVMIIVFIFISSFIYKKKGISRKEKIRRQKIIRKYKGSDGERHEK